MPHAGRQFDGNGIFSHAELFDHFPGIIQNLADKTAFDASHQFPFALMTVGGKFRTRHCGDVEPVDRICRIIVNVEIGTEAGAIRRFFSANHQKNPVKNFS